MGSVYQVWFVPTNSSHMAKLRPFMDALRDRGHEVRLACVDLMQDPLFATRSQMEQAGYPFEVVPPDRFGGNRRMFEVIRGPGVRRAIDRFLAGCVGDAIVFGADTGLVSRAFIRVAAARGIPTVLVPDGLVLLPNPQYRGSLENRLVLGLCEVTWRAVGAKGDRGRSGVDLILVMNETGRAALIQSGVPADRIRAVGSCEYDALAARLSAGLEQGEGERVSRRLGLPAGRPVVFFAHQEVVDVPTTRQHVLTMVSAVRRCGACVLVKFHPRLEQRLEEWRAWARQAGLGGHEVVFAWDECTSVEAVRLCTVCVTIYSTVAMEALVFRKPLILIQYVNVPYLLPYGQHYGAALEVESPKALEQAIVSLLTDEDAKQRLARGHDVAIEKELLGLNGQSAERMVSELIGLIEKRRGAGKS